MFRAQGTYIDNLTVDVRCIIVRKLSDAPRSRQWRRYLTPSAILFLFHPQGPFRNDLGTVFSILSIGWREVLLEDELNMTTDVAETLNVLKYLGDGLKHLIYRTTSNVYRGLSYIFSPLKCLELCVIRLPDFSLLPWVQIISQFASSLETLVLDGKCDECPSFGVDFPHLKEFHVSNGFDCAYLLQVLGENLEIFGCRNTFPDSGQVLNALQALPYNSAKLREIDVPFHFAGTDIYSVELGEIFVSCLLSYGAQLTKVRMDILRPNPILCGQVLRECPNMVCTIHKGYTWDYLNDIQVLAPRIRKLQLCARFFDSTVEVDPDFFVSVLNRFDNLNELVIYDFRILDIAFQIPLATLRNLCIQHEPDFEYDYEEENILSTKVLCNLLISVASLETLEVTTQSFEDEKAFFQLLNSNSNLKIVRVTLEQPVKQQLALQIVQCVLKAVISHQHLEELKIEFKTIQGLVDSEFFSTVNDFVQPYRFKRTHIEVQLRRYFH